MNHAPAQPSVPSARSLPSPAPRLSASTRASAIALRCAAVLVAVTSALVGCGGPCDTGGLPVLPPPECRTGPHWDTNPPRPHPRPQPRPEPQPQPQPPPVPPEEPWTDLVACTTPPEMHTPEGSTPTADALSADLVGRWRGTRVAPNANGTGNEPGSAQIDDVEFEFRADGSYRARCLSQPCEGAIAYTDRSHASRRWSVTQVDANAEGWGRVGFPYSNNPDDPSTGEAVFDRVQFFESGLGLGFIVQLVNAAGDAQPVHYVLRRRCAPQG